MYVISLAKISTQIPTNEISLNLYIIILHVATYKLHQKKLDFFSLSKWGNHLREGRSGNHPPCYRRVMWSSRIQRSTPNRPTQRLPGFLRSYPWYVKLESRFLARFSRSGSHHIIKHYIYIYIKHHHENAIPSHLQKFQHQCLGSTCLHLKRHGVNRFFICAGRALPFLPSFWDQCTI